MEILILILALSWIYIIWIYKNAPEGYEDETGFHYGERNKLSEIKYDLPNFLPDWKETRKTK